MRHGRERKRCSKCKRWLSLASFGFKKADHKRRKSWCRRCATRARNKFYRPPPPLMSFWAVRTCLRCGRPFGSVGPGNRLCGRCSEWAEDLLAEPRIVHDPRVR